MTHNMVRQLEYSSPTCVFKIWGAGIEESLGSLKSFISTSHAGKSQASSMMLIIPMLFEI